MNYPNHSSDRKPSPGDKLAGAAGNPTGKYGETADKVLANSALEVQGDSDRSVRNAQQPVGKFRTAFGQYTRFHPFS